MIIVKTPELAESVAEATLLDWQKQPGDAVAEGEILVSVETDKIVLEVYAPQGGVLQEILKKEGDSVVSDEPLARIDETAQAASVPAPRRKRPKNRNPRPPPLQPPRPRRANRRRCLRRAKSRPSAASNCPRSKAAGAAAESQNPTRSRRRLNLLLPLPPPGAKRNASR